MRIALLTTAFILMGAAIPASAAEFRPGMEQSAMLPGTEKRVVVHLPSTYSATETWPVVFYYHGMGGQPNTTRIRRHMGSFEAVVVGMSYLDRAEGAGGREPYDAYMGREQKQFRKVLVWLRDQLSIDTKRIYLTGISKGGWQTAELGEREAANIAGMVILLAGRHPVANVGAPPASMRGMPIYVGAGEDDANLVAALRAKLAYGKAGSHVTLDVFEWLGHRVPDSIPKLTAWFETQKHVLNRSATDETRETLTADAQSRYKAALEAESPDAQYRELRELADDPCLFWCGERVHQGVWRKMEQLALGSTHRGAWQAEQEMLRVVGIESNIRRIKDFEAILEGLTRIKGSAGDTLYGRVAERLIEPYKDAYIRSVEATREANPPTTTTPEPKTTTISPSFGGASPSRRTYVRPVREGNRVIFERD